MTRAFAALLVVSVCACSRSAPPPEIARAAPSPAVTPAAPAAASWLGEHAYRSTDGNGLVSVVSKDGGLEVTLEVAQADGCTGSIGGVLEIHDAHARLAPPLFVVSGTQRDAASEPCELAFELGANGAVVVTEASCDGYHGLNCRFAGDYPLVAKR
jgi:hypothetical protein